MKHSSTVNATARQHQHHVTQALLYFYCFLTDSSIYCLFSFKEPKGGSILTGLLPGSVLHRDAQLKAGLWTPDRPRTGALLPLRRLSEKMKKQTLTTPRMITPEIRALVTVFI